MTSFSRIECLGRGLACGFLLHLCVGLAPVPALSQESSSRTPKPERLSPVEEANRAAERAEEAAAAARAFADELAAEDPSAPEGSAPSAASGGRPENPQSPNTTPSPDPASSADAAALSDAAALEAAVARAEEAAEQAALAARAIDQAERKRRRQSERTGAYFGAAFFYAAENFDDRVIVKSSTGGAAFVGYRLAPVVAVEVRYEGFDGFDLKGTSGRGEIDGSVVTFGAKAYPFKGPIQPFLGFGLGAAFFKQKLVFNDGSRSRENENDLALRFAAGLDLWLTKNLVLNAEAAYLSPADDLSNLEATLLSTGLTFRF